MKAIRKLSMMVPAVLLAGCTAYQLPPLTASHPANPEAMAAVERLPAKTLAYTAADVPSVQPVAVVSESVQGAAGVRETVVGEGKVVATVPNAGQIVVEHGEIKGFMDAMTMGYRVEPPALLEGLKSGDEVRFTIDVPRKAIVMIERGPLLAATATSQQGPVSPGSEASPKKTVVGEGKVVATVPNAGQIVVDHQEIKGFMEAMTMGYRIEPLSLLEGLKFGDQIRFTIDVEKKAIIKIEKLK